MKFLKKIRFDFKHRAAMAAIAAGAGLQLSDDDRVNMFIIGFWIIGGIIEGIKSLKDLPKDSDKKKGEENGGRE
jgi:hypothetical protein